MKYFEFRFEHKTRPMFRKGRHIKAFKVFAANDLAEAYRVAADYWKGVSRGQECKIFFVREVSKCRNGLKSDLYLENQRI